MSGVIILGAGMAGLLAGNLFLKDGFLVNINERQPTLPHNHSALLRFRSSVVGEVTGVTFKKVSVMKWTMPFENPITDALAYAAKVSGIMRSDRSISAFDEVVERWVAPDDFILQLATPLKGDLHFSIDWSPHPDRLTDVPVISTMPMPALMDMFDYPKARRPDFQYCHGYNLIVTLNSYVNAYATIYVPSPHLPFNRVSITGHTLVAEFASPNLSYTDAHNEMHMRQQNGVTLIRETQAALDLFGIPHQCAVTYAYRMQRFAKILPVDDDLRKTFMYWASKEHNIYSLGRFATWRPGLLLDDLPQDIRKITGWIKSGNYDLLRHMS